MSALCQARQPLGVFPRSWQVCGQPATAAYDYQCGCGLHSRTGSTCEAHQPVEGDVGCSQCWDLGHECPMTFTKEQAP